MDQKFNGGENHNHGKQSSITFTNNASMDHAKPAQFMYTLAANILN